MNKKHIYILGIVTFLIIVFAFALQKNITQPDDTPEPPTQEEKTAEEIPQTQAKERPEIEVPDGWVKYWNDEWGIGFAYPGDWDFHDSSKNTGIVSLRYGCASGSSSCVYDIRFSDRTGRGLPDLKWTHPEYVIDDKVAEKTWQTERPGREDGYLQIIIVNGFLFQIYTPDKTKILSDLILSTVKFY